MADNDNQLTDGEKDNYLRVYLAEFEALSTRLTYWLTLQYVPYTIAAVAFGYFVQSWKPSEYPHVAPSLAWAGLFILQLLMWGVLQSTHEVFTYVVYFKECLKPKMREVVSESGPSFLDFESFVAKLRQAWFLRFESRFGLMLVVAAGIIGASWVALQNTPPPRLCQRSTIGWGIANGYALFILVFKSRDIGRLQKRAEAADPPAPICP